MTIYTFPKSLWKVAQVSLTLGDNSAMTPQSAFNPYVSTDGPTSEFWQASVTITSQDADDWRDVAAMIRKLRGRQNKIRLYDPSRPLRGAGASGPTINIAADAVAGASSIQVTGLTASQAVALAADDVLGIGENLYAVSDDAPSDSSGNATLNILAPLRQGVAVGDPVTLASADMASISGPTGLFHLVAGGDSQIVAPGGIRQPLSLQFVEDPDFD